MAYPFSLHRYSKIGHIALLCYDVNGTDAVDAKESLQQCELDGCAIVVVGCKSDLQYSISQREDANMLKNAHPNIVCCLEVNMHRTNALQRVLDKIVHLVRVQLVHS